MRVSADNVTMNGELQPSVPIITFAGLTNLSNVLHELPLPTPIEPQGKNKSLLFNPRVADEARRVLATADPNIVSQMAHVLRQSNTDHIQLKDGYTDDTIQGDVPHMVRALLAQHPDVFCRPMHNMPSQAAGFNQGYEGRVQPMYAQQQTVPAAYSNQQSVPTMPYANSPHYSGVNQQQYNSPRSSQSSHYDPNTSVPPSIPPTHYGEPYCPQQPAASQTSQHTNANITPQPAFRSHISQRELNQKPNGKESSFSQSSSQKLHDSHMKGSVLSLQPLSAEEIDKYIGSSSGSAAPKAAVATDIPQDPIVKMMPSIRLKKLDVGSSYAVTDLDSSGGLKLKLKKADGSQRFQGKRKGSELDEDGSRKKKKKHKHKEHKSLRRDGHILGEDYESHYNVKYLVTVIDSILDSCSSEDIALAASGVVDGTSGISPDILVARSLLTELANEAAKLKDMSSSTPDIPVDKLSRLMTILQWNVLDGSKLLPMLGQTEDSDQEQVLWRDLTVDRVQRSLEAAQASLYLMTSPDMPKVVYLEDLIELISEMVKYQLVNNIYPEFDPVYRNSKNKEYVSSKMKRSRATGGTKHKSVTLMFNKLCELVNNLTDLVAMQPLTDTVILKISSLGVQPFFVENVSELQLGAIMLVTEIFSRYEKHRQLILEDIFSSLANLPTSKRNLRTYRLSHDEHIQMVTALVLQLIQCIVKLPQKKDDDEDDDGCDDVLIVTSYEQAMKTAHHFLSVFLKKCAQKGEEDNRPLFDNFVNDLLVTSNKPEWPAAELMLSLLGRLLVQQFSNKQVDMALRVASLDYLGTVAARLRKDAISTQQTDIDEMLESISDDDSTASDEADAVKDVTQKLQIALLEYLYINGQKETTLMHVRNFYIGQWYRDITVQAEKSAVKQAETDPSDVEEMERANEAQKLLEKKKQILLEQAYIENKRYRKNAKLGYSNASAATKFLTLQRPFSQSFDVYLAQILKVLSETSVAVRTKAMKCLTLVVEADPGILARPDLRQGVHARFLDQSTSVREACVELVGKFILSRPDLIAQYYDMIAARILDTGISVRKRVIKIFRDVCVEQPKFDKIPDMCVKMIRRVNDEDGIKKLVTEVFQTMWFTPVKEKHSDKLMRRVLNITTVVSAIRDSSYEFIEHLMKALLATESELASKPVEEACKQIVDTLVMNVLKLEQKAVEISDGKIATSRDLVSSLATLHLFSKVRPDLMIEHADTLQPYLEIKCSNAADNMVLHHTARILELVIPLIEHPREAFLAQIEEDLMTLVLRQGMTVVQSAISCLGAVVNKVTHNYSLVKDCFKKFQNIVFNCHKEHQISPNSPALQSRKAALRRSIFTIGVLCLHFDFDSPQMDMKTSVSRSIEDLVFEQIMYFVWHEEEVVRNQALTALGFYNIRYYSAMLGTRVKELYHRLLIGKDISVDMRVQVLNNLGKYLQEEEEKIQRADAEWSKNVGKEDLKEMGDVQSGMASTIMQVYLKQVLEAYFNSQIQVRTAACNVLNLILKQGLVHPVQCVPYLIAMSADCDSNVRLKADQHLIDINKKYPGFLHMKAMAGMKMSYRLHRLIQQDMYQPLRGIRNEESPQSLNHHLYSIIRTNRSHRRALLTNLLNLFDDTSKTLLGELVYMADNLAFFPYQVADEPLFIMHHIDIIVSVSGSNLLQAFREGLLGKDGQLVIRDQDIQVQYDPITGEPLHSVQPPQVDDDEDEESAESLYKKLPEDCSVLQDCIITAQGCTLLLLIKQHLKEMYNITDSKLNKYSPNDSQKVSERPINRRVGVTFSPRQALDMMRIGSPRLDVLDEASKMKLVSDYLAFKYQMNLVDPIDDEEDEKPTAQNTSAIADPAAAGDVDADLDISSMPVEDADLYASNIGMQPTISIIPMSMTDMPPEMLAQLQTPQTKGKAAKDSNSSKNRRPRIESDSSDSDTDDY